MLLVLQVIVFVVFVVVSYRLVRAMARESVIRKEFGLSSLLPIMVWLFPVGAALVLIAPALAVSSSIGFVAAAAMYVPAFVLARRQERLLQVAGTDRVKEMRRTAEQAFGWALCGLIYVVAVWALSWGASSIRSVGQGA